MSTLTDAFIPHNRTRRTRSFPAKFLREGRPWLIPMYWLLRLSDLAREGMENSGSFRFADHLYRNRASGRTWLGRGLDWLLLRMPTSRAMRARCGEATREMHRAFRQHLRATPGEPFRLLTVPCGLPRDVRTFLQEVAASARPELTAQVHYCGLDVDPEVIRQAQVFLQDAPAGSLSWSTGNALDPEAYPAGPFHFVASTGLGEFLAESELEQFFRQVHAALAPGGTFFTSALGAGCFARSLLEHFELRAHYRGPQELERALASSLWRTIEIWRDTTGLDTFVRAVKGDTR